jgi:hypothetical protein
MLTKPKHRRTLPGWVTMTDLVQNEAACVHLGEPPCSHTLCPRHQPEAYAEMMARHAVDSI